MSARNAQARTACEVEDGSRRLVEVEGQRCLVISGDARHALEHMTKGGCIINCGSVTSFRGSEHLMDYAATKGAIESFTSLLAKNLAPGASASTASPESASTNVVDFMALLKKSLAEKKCTPARSRAPASAPRSRRRRAAS